ncbi:MAG: hypothetical protein IMW99_11455 [Firmicutes bacterium]|nr:hypothetical protein [Bacillota bacterium]
MRRWRTVFARLAGGILGILPGAGAAATAGTAGATGTGAGAAGGSEAGVREAGAAGAGATGAGAAPAGAAGGLALQGAAARLQPADVTTGGGPAGGGSAGEDQDGHWRRLSGQLVDVLLAVRDLARQQKNWQEADYIRERLKELGVTVEDTPTGTRWQWAQLVRRGGGKPGESQPAERNG